MKNFFLKLVGLLLVVTQNISLANAQDRPPIIPANSTLILPHSAGSSEKAIADSLIPTVTKTLIALAGTLAVAFIIYGGIQILTAYGKQDKIESAKKTITYAIAGLVIALLSYAIVSIVAGIRFT